MPNLYTQITKANIYRGGAELVRRGTVELSAGRQTLFVYGMSNTTRTDTARLYGPAGVSCSDLRIMPRFGESGNPEATALQERIDALKLHIEVRELQTEMWKSNGDFKGRTSLPVSEVQEYIEKLPGRLEKINEDILATKKEIRKLEKELKNVQGNDSLPILAAEVTAEKAGTYSFELRYFENNARWKPVYEIHSDGKAPFEMRMKGHITQLTYEDWKGVELSLLTGNPVMAGTLPELSPILLDIRQPMPASRAVLGRSPMTTGRLFSAPKAKMAMEDEACEEMDMADEEASFGSTAPLPVLMTAAEADMTTGETSTEYKLPGKRDVQKNGRETVADVNSVSVPATYRIVTVPKLDAAAYLVAAVKPSDLPGTNSIDAAVYLNETYTGKVHLYPDLTKEELDLTIGREERIFTSRKELPKKTSSTLIKNQRTTEYTIELTVRNESPAPVTVTVKDQIPVSENKEIQVDILELSGAKREEATGFLTWDLSLACGEAQTVRFSYKVSSPKDKQIQEIF
ncbi:MAG: DUF4139 domain-containing protein [Lachnospiraceae bacterium]|nr:DUF4139 domain-containing protein [Lachnospiraceae bacterium]